MVTATRCVYSNPNVVIHHDENGMFSIRAKTDLDIGSMVVVEHVYSGTFIEMNALLILDDKLRRSLYPRCALDQDNALDVTKNAMKISLNAFGFGEDMVIGNYVCKFNHACKPNAYMNCVNQVNNTKFYGVWTVAKVKQGDELTLDYINGHSEYHDTMKEQHGFTCSCTKKDLDGARGRAKIELSLATKFTRNNTTLLDKMVDIHCHRWDPEMHKAHKKVRDFAKNNIRAPN